MGTKLYVGGIPYATTPETLQAHFAPAGSVVSCTIIRDKYTGRSKGFGFIEFATGEEAQKAISMFHDQMFEGRKLTVSEARPPRESGPGDHSMP